MHVFACSLHRDEFFITANLSFLSLFRGCLAQEKIVASCAKQFIIVADDRYMLMFSEDFNSLAVKSDIMYYYQG